MGITSSLASDSGFVSLQHPSTSSTINSPHPFCTTGPSNLEGSLLLKDNASQNLQLHGLDSPSSSTLAVATRPVQGYKFFPYRLLFRDKVSHIPGSSETHHVAEDDLELLTFLLLSPKCWDLRCM